MHIFRYCSFFSKTWINPQQLCKTTEAEQGQVITLKACLLLFSSPRQDLSSSAQCCKNLRWPDFSWPTTTSGISYYTLTSTASGARIHILVRHCSAACCARKRMRCFPILLFLPTCGRKRFSFALLSKQNRYISLKKCYLLKGEKNETNMLVSFNKWHVILLRKTHKLLCYSRVTIF